MASLKEVRSRIISVKSAQQITKAMKMVSAAKLKRAQDAIVQMRPYATKLREILENLSGSVENMEGGAYAKIRPVHNVLILAITSNRGLAGAFNANIIRQVNSLLANELTELYKTENIKLAAIGKKASDFFVKNKRLYIGNHNDLYNNLDFEHTSAIAESFMQEFVDGKWDKVIMVYNHFRNAAVQQIKVEQLLPLSPEEKPKTGEEVKKKNIDYIFEPSKVEIVRELIPKAIKIQFHKAVLDSHASEHGARMTAMSKATDNAGELLRDLRVKYNKARQAAITKEILEIVGGAEALKG
jgi:F-type H+-transporting ATPase subunit gamma